MLDFFLKKLKLGYFLQSVKWNKSPQPTRNTSTEEKNTLLKNNLSIFLQSILNYTGLEDLNLI